MLKGDSQNSQKFKTLDDNKKKQVKSDKPVKVSYVIGVTTIAKRILEQRDLKEQKYFKLLDILTEPSFLERCYLEIRSKPGNMTKGSDSETLDGINRK